MRLQSVNHPQLPITVATADQIETFSLPIFAAYCSKNGKMCCEGLSRHKRIIAPKKAVQSIKDGGYATSLTYVEKLCSIIEKWKLTDYGRGQFCPVGVYTIMEVRAGQGSKAGWGRLKNGIGWISLDFMKRV